jgi:hypothetical protein
MKNTGVRTPLFSKTNGVCYNYSTNVLVLQEGFENFKISHVGERKQ